MPLSLEHTEGFPAASKYFWNPPKTNRRYTPPMRHLVAIGASAEKEVIQ